MSPLPYVEIVELRDAVTVVVVDCFIKDYQGV